MSIEYSDDNPFYKLKDFLPPLDDSIQMLEKYVGDMAYHYERGFYNLALFSFHYVYMTLLHIYLLKFHRMKVSIVNSCRQKRTPLEHLSPHAYCDVRDEKGRVHLFAGLNKEIATQHAQLVITRDSIAHATGTSITIDVFDRHIDNAINVLSSIQKHSLDIFIQYPSDSFNETVAAIKTELNDAEKLTRISDMIKDFYISRNDWQYLTSVGFINFGEYDDFI